MLLVGTGVVELSGLKSKHMGVFMPVLRYRLRFMEVDEGSVDKVDKLELRCRLAPYRGGWSGGRK